MLNKKSPQANLEDKKAISLLIGFVFALSILYVSLEWSGKVTVYIPDDSIGNYEEPLFIPPTMEPLPPKSIPRPPEPVVDKLRTPDFANLIPVDNIKGTSENAIELPDPEPTNEAVIIGPGYIAVEEEEEIVDFLPAADMPKFPGDVLKYLSQNIRYPVVDQEQGISGRVICQFVIDKDGSIVDVIVVRGVSPTIDKEAVRVIKSMPKWTPGKQHGKSVKVKYTLPINFALK